MKTFIYTIQDGSRKRGFNTTIRVFRMINNKPHFIALNEEISTGWWKGGYAVACQIISDKLGYKMSKGSGHIGRGYSLVNKNIRLFEI